MLLCHSVPAIYNPVARHVLLPAALVLLTRLIGLSILLRFSPKPLNVFRAGPLGIGLGTVVALLPCFTHARRLADVGALKVGSLFLCFLIACIGIWMDLLKRLDNLWLFALGAVWIGVRGL